MFKRFFLKRNSVFFAMLAFLTTFMLYAAPAGADMTDPIDPEVSGGAINTFAIQPDGKILIGGSFTGINGVGRNGIARLYADGSLDLSFNPGSGVDNEVNAIAVDKYGRIIIGGGFTDYNGTVRGNLARLHASGSLDSSFDPGSGTDNRVYTITVQKNGKILIGGRFARYNGTISNHLARLEANGALDPTFTLGSGADANIYAIAIQSDGAILIGGFFTHFDGTLRNHLARLHANGSLDTTFAPHGSGLDHSVLALDIQADGRIVIGGVFTSFNGISRNHIARLMPNGTLDNSFDPGSGTNDNILKLSIQPDGRIVIGGSFTIYNGVASNRIARLMPDGDQDRSFNVGSGANNWVQALALLPDGRIIIAGSFTSFNGITRNNIAHLNINGHLDEKFDPGSGPSNLVFAIALQPNGRILIGGSFTSYSGSTRYRIARLNSNGSLDYTFSGMGIPNNAVNALALQPDGRILIAGPFTSVSGVTRNHIARLNSNGPLDTAFNPGTGANNTINALALQPDGKILIAGAFTSFNGVTRNHIARLEPDGSLDTTFNSGTNFAIEAMALQPDGRILIGGQFSSVAGTSRNHIARLNVDGSLDTSFDPGTGTDAYVVAIAYQRGKFNDHILIAGDFLHVNGSTRNQIAMLNTDGSLTTWFDPGEGPDQRVAAVVPLADGTILIGGQFTTVNGFSRNHIARLLAEGTFDPSFNPGTGANNYVSTLAVQPDGRILLGGAFTSLDGASRNHIARISPREAARKSLTVDEDKVISWLNEGSAPALSTTTLDISTDGISWQPFSSNGFYYGGSTWSFDGARPPFNVLRYIRARGYSSNGSGIQAESISQIYLRKKNKFYIIRSPSGRAAVIAL